MPQEDAEEIGRADLLPLDAENKRIDLPPAKIHRAEESGSSFATVLVPLPPSNILLFITISHSF